MHILHGEIAVLVLLKLFINTMVVKDAYLTWRNSSLGFVEAVRQNNGSERCIAYMRKKAVLVLLKMFINTVVVKDAYLTCENSSLGFVKAVRQYNGSERCISYMGT